MTLPSVTRSGPTHHASRRRVPTDSDVVIPRGHLAGSVQLLTVVYMPSSAALVSFNQQLESEPEAIYLDTLGTTYGPTLCRLVEPPPPPHHRPAPAAGSASPAPFAGWNTLEVKLLAGGCGAVWVLVCGAMTCRALRARWRQRANAASLNAAHAAFTAPAYTAPPIDSLRSRWSARSPLFTGGGGDGDDSAHAHAHAHAHLTPHGATGQHPHHHLGSSPQPTSPVWHGDAARVGIVLDDLPSVLYVDAAGTAHVLVEERTERCGGGSLKGGALVQGEDFGPSSSSREEAGALACHGGTDRALVVVDAMQ